MTSWIWRAVVLVLVAPLTGVLWVTPASAADTSVPVLTSIARTSPDTLRPGQTLSLDYATDEEPDDLGMLQFSFRGSIGNTVAVGTEPNPVSAGTLTLVIPDTMPNGDYTLNAVYIYDDTAIFAGYHSDGTISKGPAGATGPTTHTLNFTPMAFTIGNEAPSPPRSVTAEPGNASAVVTWRASSSDGGAPVSSHTVVASPGGATMTVPAGVNRATVTGLTNGVSHTFQVTATNDVGTSRPSAPSAAVVPLAVPGPPRYVSATAGDARATVSWTKPEDAGGSAITGYTVTSQPGGLTRTVGPSLRSATLTGLTNGTSYTFTVVATNAAGVSPRSEPTPTVRPLGVPAAPSGVTATAGDTRATVTWVRPSDSGGTAITGYTVTAYPSGITKSVPASTRTVTMTGLTNATSYGFRVTATNAVGTSAPSAVSNQVVPAGVPTEVSWVIASAGDTRALIEWMPAYQNGSKMQSFTITTYPGGATTTVPASARRAWVGGLTNGSSYYFRIRATNLIGSGPQSAPTNRVTPVAIPDPPTAVRATPGNGEVSVAWARPAATGGSPITGYDVVTYPGGATTRVGPTLRTAKVTGLVNGKSYIVRVFAVNAVGPSIPSEPTEPFVTTGPPPPPGTVTATAGDSTATVTWTPPPSGGFPITGYVITSDFGGVDRTVKAGVRSVALTGLVNGTAYAFTVAAVNAYGTSAGTTAAAVTPTPSTAALRGP